VKSLKAEINNLLVINKAPVNRPLFWGSLSSRPDLWKSTYEASYWHIIQYLVKDLGFNITPLLRVE
jgi:hypothetical protein